MYNLRNLLIFVFVIPVSAAFTSESIKPPIEINLSESISENIRLFQDAINNNSDMNLEHFLLIARWDPAFRDDNADFYRQTVFKLLNSRDSKFVAASINALSYPFESDCERILKTVGSAVIDEQSCIESLRYTLTNIAEQIDPALSDDTLTSLYNVTGHRKEERYGNMDFNESSHSYTLTVADSIAKHPKKDHALWIVENTMNCDPRYLMDANYYEIKVVSEFCSKRGDIETDFLAFARGRPVLAASVEICQKHDQPNYECVQKLNGLLPYNPSCYRPYVFENFSDYYGSYYYKSCMNKAFGG